MAIHYSVPSMLQESLVEMILVAKYCINYQKDLGVWKSRGCYGYPAAILLFSIADSIGSYVIGGKTRKHFDILNHKDYYNLRLAKNSIDIIYEKYRCLLTHNARMAVNTVLDMGDKNSVVFEVKERIPYINLLPFLNISKTAVIKFLERVVLTNRQLKDVILN